MGWIKSSEDDDETQKGGTVQRQVVIEFLQRIVSDAIELLTDREKDMASENL